MKYVVLTVAIAFGLGVYWYFQADTSRVSSASRFEKYERQLNQVESLDDLYQAFDRLPSLGSHGPYEYTEFMSVYKPKVMGDLHVACSIRELVIKAPGLEQLNLVSRLRRNTDILGIKLSSYDEANEVDSNELIMEVRHTTELLRASYYHYDGSVASGNVPSGRSFSGTISIGDGEDHKFGMNIEPPENITRYGVQPLKSDDEWQMSTLEQVFDETFRTAFVEALIPHCSSLGLAVIYLDVTEQIPIEEIEFENRIDYKQNDQIEMELLDDINEIAPLLYLIESHAFAVSLMGLPNSFGGHPN